METGEFNVSPSELILLVLFFFFFFTMHIGQITSDTGILCYLFLLSVSVQGFLCCFCNCF